jgi:ferric iron reductase protein FhuF
VYAQACAAVPELAGFLAGGSVGGAVLADPRWLAQRLTQAGARWSLEDRRVVATIWWYSASSTLLAPPVVTLAVAGRAADPGLADLTVHVRPDSYLGAARARALLDGGPAELGEAIRAAFDPIIAGLAQASGAAVRPLWAIATDSLATWALRAGTATGTVEKTAELSRAVARGVGPVMPLPRYVDVAPSRRYVRRASCCLIYAVPGCDKCTACPRQTPAERLRRLSVHALAMP